MDEEDPTERRRGFRRRPRRRLALKLAIGAFIISVTTAVGGLINGYHTQADAERMHQQVQSQQHEIARVAHDVTVL